MGFIPLWVVPQFTLSSVLLKFISVTSCFSLYVTFDIKTFSLKFVFLAIRFIQKYLLLIIMQYLLLNKIFHFNSSYKILFPLTKLKIVVIILFTPLVSFYIPPPLKTSENMLFCDGFRGYRKTPAA